MYIFFTFEFFKDKTSDQKKFVLFFRQVDYGAPRHTFYAMILNKKFFNFLKFISGVNERILT